MISESIIKQLLKEDKTEVIFSSLVKNIDFSIAKSISDRKTYLEGDVVVTRVKNAVGYRIGGGLLTSSVVEDYNGTIRVLTPSSLFITVVGNRESTFWTIAHIDVNENIPFSLVSLAGLCSRSEFSNQKEKIEVDILGHLIDENNNVINMKNFITKLKPARKDRLVGVNAFIGTAAEVGKTTSLLKTIEFIRKENSDAVITVAKLSGTASIAESNLYLSYGATNSLNLIDFGFPSSYTDDIVLLKNRIHSFFKSSVAQNSDYIFLELGGDVIGGNNAEIINFLKANTLTTFILSAITSFDALGCISYLTSIGISVSGITGKCTSNPIVKTRLERLVKGIPAFTVLDNRDVYNLYSLIIDSSGSPIK